MINSFVPVEMKFEGFLCAVLNHFKITLKLKCEGFASFEFYELHVLKILKKKREKSAKKGLVCILHKSFLSEVK